MKVCIFTDTLGDLNGVSRFIQDMGRQAREYDFDLHIVTSTVKPLPEAPYIHNLPPRLRIPMPFYRDLDLTFATRKALESKLLELDPDIVHVSTPGPVGYTARGLALRYGYSVMGTYHTDISAYVGLNTRLALLKRATDRFMARFYEGFLHVFTRSKEYAAVMQRDIRIPPETISFLKPGTDLKTFHPDHREADYFERYGVSRRSINALYVGRITEDKNILFLIEVWKELQRRNPDREWHLFLAGEGRYRKLQPKLQKQSIHFLGPVVGEALSRLYASSDLFLFPSVADTLGQVVMEAQASALPVVVSDIGGPKSLVNFNGRQSGLIAGGNDLEAWVAAAAALLKDAKLRRKLGKQGHENMSYFDIENSFRHFASTHEAIWKENDTP
jgi:glycosyltransferase involved in cell wall biosynthesis